MTKRYLSGESSEPQCIPGLEQPAASPAPSAAQQNPAEDWIALTHPEYRGAWSAETVMEFAEAYADRSIAPLREHLEKLDRWESGLKKIHAEWGHVEGKQGCQCPICQKNFEAFCDVFCEYDMQLHLPGGFKERAEKAESELATLREQAKELAEALKGWGEREDVDAT